MEETPMQIATRGHRNAALIAGIGLLLMAIIAPLANFMVVQNVAAEEGPQVVTKAIVEAGWTFRFAALGLLVVAALDVLVAWGLYRVFRPTNAGLSLFGAWMRLVYSVLFALAISQLFVAANLAGDDALGTHRSFASFNAIWDLSLFFFGLHLVLVGILAYRASFIHGIFGVLLVLSGLGYLFDSIAILLVQEFGFEISMFTFIGEVILIVWLFVFGLKRRSPGE